MMALVLGMRQSAVYALVLAAGGSSRFGREKLTAEYRGRPLIMPILETIASGISQGLLAGGGVVHRPGSAELRSLARNAGLDAVENARANDGLAGSLRIGLATAAAHAAHAILVVPGDQPQVRLEVIRLLVVAWQRGAGPALRPRYHGDPERPGHPVLLDHSLWPLLETIEGDAGFNQVLLQHPEWVTRIDVDGSNPDIDTPADLRANSLPSAS